MFEKWQSYIYPGSNVSVHLLDALQLVQEITNLSPLRLEGKMANISFASKAKLGFMVRLYGSKLCEEWFN